MFLEKPKFFKSNCLFMKKVQVNHLDCRSSAASHCKFSKCVVDAIVALKVFFLTSMPTKNLKN